MSKSMFLKYSAIGLIGLSSTIATICVKYREGGSDKRPGEPVQHVSETDKTALVGEWETTGQKTNYDLSTPKEVFRAFVERYNDDDWNVVVNILDPSFYLYDMIVNGHVDAKYIPEYKNIFGAQINLSEINKTNAPEMLSIMKKRAGVLCALSKDTRVEGGRNILDGILFDQFVEQYNVILEADTAELIGKSRERTLKELNPKEEQEHLALLGFDPIRESVTLTVEWKPRNREMEACGYHIVTRGNSKFVYPRRYFVTPKEIMEVRKLKEQKELQSQNK